MVKRKPISISMQDKDIDLLNQVAKEVGLSKSDLIRRLVIKAACDEKLKAILKRGYFATSNNVHYANEEKKADETEGNQKPGHDSGPDSSSLESTNNILKRIEDLKMQLQINIARTNWTDDCEESAEFNESLRKEAEALRAEIAELERQLQQ